MAWTDQQDLIARDDKAAHLPTRGMELHASMKDGNLAHLDILGTSLSECCHEQQSQLACCITYILSRQYIGKTVNKLTPAFLAAPAGGAYG